MSAFLLSNSRRLSSVRSEFLVFPVMKPPSFLDQEVKGELAERDESETTDLLEGPMLGGDWGLVMSGADFECGIAGLGIELRSNWKGF